jgi:hypothetical protein
MKHCKKVSILLQQDKKEINISLHSLFYRILIVLFFSETTPTWKVETEKLA